VGLVFAGPSSVNPAPGKASDPGLLTVYVGSYSPADQPGIHQLTLNPATGELRSVGRTAGLANPSFLAFHPSHRYLYAVSEVDDFEGRKTGAVVALSIDAATGALTLLNRQASEGGGPCHLTVDRDGRHVLVANYGGGSVAVLPIGPDGRLGPAASVVRHQGSSVNKSRQEGPHAHSIDLDRAGRFALVADLGLDKVMVYRFDPKGTLTAADPPWAALSPGSGPRHLALDPRGRFVYAINELTSTVVTFAYDGAAGALRRVASASTLPDGFKGESYPAEIAVSADGRFLYGSNRGHDSIAAFAIDAASGRPRPIGHTPTGGSWPRHFALDPTGSYLLAANQKSDSVVVFRIDGKTGALAPTGHRIELPKPVCVLVRPASR
jgi:6-phosphogluconolactonase